MKKELCFKCEHFKKYACHITGFALPCCNICKDKHLEESNLQENTTYDIRRENAITNSIVVSKKFVIPEACPYLLEHIVI